MVNESGDTPMTIPQTLRTRGWEHRLVDAMRLALARPFAWEGHNCGDLMAEAVRACHGDDHPLLAELVHGTETEVVESVIERGGLDTILGKYLQMIPQLHAQDGDLATLGTGDGPRAGCVVLSGCVCGIGTERTYRFPISKLNNVHVFRL